MPLVSFLIASEFCFLILKLNKVIEGVMACCVLHNLIATRKPKQLAAAANFEDPDTGAVQWQ